MAQVEAVGQREHNETMRRRESRHECVNGKLLHHQIEGTLPSLLRPEYQTNIQIVDATTLQHQLAHSHMAYHLPLLSKPSFMSEAIKELLKCYDKQRDSSNVALELSLVSSGNHKCAASVQPDVHRFRRRMAPPLAGLDAKMMSEKAAAGSSLPASTSLR